MTKLNTAQRDLLTQAAGAEGGAVDATSAAKPTAAVLIRRGLVISIPEAGAPSRLLITEAGRAAIGAPADPTPPPANKTSPAVSEPKGKIGAMITLLRCPKGATVEALMVATGWQAHSVRGAMSGAIKKDRGLPVISDKTDGGRVYRIVDGAGA